jgi:hypothetical protein
LKQNEETISTLTTDETLQSIKGILREKLKDYFTDSSVNTLLDNAFEQEDVTQTQLVSSTNLDNSTFSASGVPTQAQPTNVLTQTMISNLDNGIQNVEKEETGDDSKATELVSGMTAESWAKVLKNILYLKNHSRYGIDLSDEIIFDRDANSGSVVLVPTETSFTHDREYLTPGNYEFAVDMIHCDIFNEANYMGQVNENMITALTHLSENIQLVDHFYNSEETKGAYSILAKILAIVSNRNDLNQTISAIDLVKATKNMIKHMANEMKSLRVTDYSTSTSSGGPRVVAPEEVDSGRVRITTNTAAHDVYPETTGEGMRTDTTMRGEGNALNYTERSTTRNDPMTDDPGATELPDYPEDDEIEEGSKEVDTTNVFVKNGITYRRGERIDVPPASYGSSSAQQYVLKHFVPSQFPWKGPWLHVKDPLPKDGVGHRELRKTPFRLIRHISGYQRELERKAWFAKYVLGWGMFIPYNHATYLSRLLNIANSPRDGTLELQFVVASNPPRSIEWRKRAIESYFKNGTVDDEAQTNAYNAYDEWLTYWKMDVGHDSSSSTSVPAPRYDTSTTGSSTSHAERRVVTYGDTPREPRAPPPPPQTEGQSTNLWDRIDFNQSVEDNPFLTAAAKDNIERAINRGGNRRQQKRSSAKDNLDTE